MKISVAEAIKAGFKDFNIPRSAQNLNRAALVMQGSSLASIAYNAAARSKYFFTITIPRAAKRLANGLYNYAKALWKVKKLDKPVKKSGKIMQYLWTFVKWMTANLKAAGKMLGSNLKTAIKTSSKIVNKYIPKTNSTANSIVRTAAKTAGAGTILAGGTTIGLLLGATIK